MSTNTSKEFVTQLSCPGIEIDTKKVDKVLNLDDINESLIVNLNVGGQEYCTLLSTLIKHPNSWLARMFNSLERSATTTNLNNSISFPMNHHHISIDMLPKDSLGRYFIDRDGYLFQFVLDFLRDDRIILPKQFNEYTRLKNELDFYRLNYKNLHFDSNKKSTDGDDEDECSKSMILYNDKLPLPEWINRSRTITVGYQGTFGYGRDGLVDVKFRKLPRILVAGHAGLCRWTFGETLNDSRDPERFSEDRYSSRFFLKHNNLEQAFEFLYEKGFDLVGCCGSGTHGSLGESKPSNHLDESRWQHYNEFVFSRRPFL